MCSSDLWSSKNGDLILPQVAKGETVPSLPQSLLKNGFSLFRDPMETWYSTTDGEQEGQRELLVQDPDGYLLRFAQYLGKRVSVIGG